MKPSLRTPFAIALAAFLTFAFAGGGRIVGSDEVTMFTLARAIAHGGIALPEGATLQGPDGRFYSKNTAGQAVLALPLVGTLRRYSLSARFARMAGVLLGGGAPLLTALANDDGYETVFRTPIRTWADRGDLLVAVSSSGESFG